MDLDVVWVALCLLGSGFFSASETALSSLPITRLEALRERSGRLTRLGLDRWAEHPQELLITILVGNNLVNVLASALATRLAYRLSSSGGIAVVVGLMTLIILVFGEITPKTVAQRHSQWLSARVAPVLYLLDLVLRPINRVLGLLTVALSRGGESKVPATEEDLLFMLRLARRHANLEADTHAMIESLLRLRQTVAREIMVPRPRVVTLDRSWDVGKVRQVIARSGHTRFPVVAGSPDDIVGLLHAKYLFDPAAERRWTDLVVEGFFVPESKPLPDLLHELRRAGPNLAIVLDEFGGLSGIVSLEDALELVVGEIEDEFDKESALLPAEGGGWSVPDFLSLRRLERVVHRPLDRPADIDSLGGLVASLTDDPVVPGTTLDWQGLQIRVLEARAGRATRLLVRDLSLPDDG